MTYLMKFKPIDVGYKFFALNDAMTGWCYVVIPEGYADDEKKKEGKMSKWWSKFLTGSIPKEVIEDE